jgi:hypothetical protein
LCAKSIQNRSLSQTPHRTSDARHTLHGGVMNSASSVLAFLAGLAAATAGRKETSGQQ